MMRCSPAVLLVGEVGQGRLLIEVGRLLIRCGGMQGVGSIRRLLVRAWVERRCARHRSVWLVQLEEQLEKEACMRAKAHELLRFCERGQRGVSSWVSQAASKRGPKIMEVGRATTLKVARETGEDPTQRTGSPTSVPPHTIVEHSLRMRETAL